MFVIEPDRQHAIVIQCLSARPLESLKVVLCRCMTGKRRPPAEEKVPGLYDIREAHFHSPGRGTIVIKVQREDDECTSGYAILDKAFYGTKDVAQCFDVASENAMTAMGYDTGKFSLCLYHSSAVAVSVFRYGDDFVVSGTRTQRKEFEEHCPSISSSSILLQLGPYTALGDVTEVRIPNRIVRWVKPPCGSGT